MLPCNEVTMWGLNRVWNSERRKACFYVTPTPRRSSSPCSSAGHPGRRWWTRTCGLGLPVGKGNKLLDTVGAAFQCASKTIPGNRCVFFSISVWNCSLVTAAHNSTLCALTVVGSSSGSSISAFLKKTFPRHTLHSILSKVGILSLLITPATNLQRDQTRTSVTSQLTSYRNSQVTNVTLSTIWAKTH